MPNPTCAVCNTDVLAATDIAGRILCARCRSASMFDALPAWPHPGYAMLPGAHQMMSGDDDEGDGGDDAEDESADDEDEDEGKFSAKPTKGKSSKGNGSFSDKPTKGGKRRPSDDDDDEDDDEALKKKGGGMGMGMILGIVFVVLTCCICFPVGGGLGVMFLGGSLIPAAGRQQSINNAKQIALAVHNYHDTNRFIPSPRSEKADLSWRVGILPFVEQGPLYNQFDHNTGWDKGKNQGLINNRPNLYDCPMRSPADKTQTPWQYFTGPNTMFPTPTTKISLMKITDGTSNTLLFAQAETPVPWSKPADIAMQPGGPIGVPQGTFIAALGDGSVRVIDRKRADDNVLRTLIDPTDGKVIPAGVLD